MDEPGLRLMVYDQTCTGRGPLPGLTHCWIAGAHLYGALGRFDAWHGAKTWSDALDFLATYDAPRAIREIQFWGHGKWGTARVGSEELNLESLNPPHPHWAKLQDVAARLDSESLWWFRTCETFGTEAGHRFAAAFARLVGSRVAGHTYVIAWAQSGLHTLRPGEAPTWSIEEGLSSDPRHRTRRARWSKFRAPNTVSFLTGAIPAGF